MRFLKKLLVGIYIFLAAFAVICLVLWVICGDEPDSLIIAAFGAAGVESIVGGVMKIREQKELKTEKTSGTGTDDEDTPRRAE